jgi:hypothetical protein
LVDVVVGEAERLVAGGSEGAVLTGVCPAVARAAVVRAVDLDGEFAVRPVEVDFEAVEVGVDQGALRR